MKIYDPFTSLLGSGGQLFQTIFLRPADFDPEITAFNSFKVDDVAYRSIALELLYQKFFECEMIRVRVRPEMAAKSRGRVDVVRVNCVSNQVIISLRPRWNHSESLTVTIGFDVDVWRAFSDFNGWVCRCLPQHFPEIHAPKSNGCRNEFVKNGAKRNLNEKR